MEGPGMQITLDYLLSGFSVNVKGKDYLSTAEYVTPFINEMKKLTNRFVVQVETSDCIPVFKGHQVLVFTTVWIQAIVKDETYHMVYQLDSKRPVWKFYKTYGNLQVIVDPNCLITGELLPGQPIPNEFNQLITHKSDTKELLDHLKNTTVTDRTTLLGRLVARAMEVEWKKGDYRVKLSPNEIITAYKAIYLESDSGDKLIDMYTYVISNICNGKDFLNIAEKILITNEIFR
jgi:hypothetical protein